MIHVNTWHGATLVAAYTAADDEVPDGVPMGRQGIAGARREIEGRLRGPGCTAERFAVRGAALGALEELYHDGLTPAARERLRRVKPPAGRAFINGVDALLHLAGWEDCP